MAGQPGQPGADGLTVNKSSRFPPIGLGIVAALTSEHWDVELLDENLEIFAYHEADLVGIMAFTASANRAYEIAATYREQGVPVVMGGIHALMCTEETLRGSWTQSLAARRRRPGRGWWQTWRPGSSSGSIAASGRIWQGCLARARSAQVDGEFHPVDVANQVALPLPRKQGLVLDVVCLHAASLAGGPFLWYNPLEEVVLNLWPLAFGFVLSTLIAWGGYQERSLSRGGVAGAIILGTVIFGLGRDLGTAADRLLCLLQLPLPLQRG